MTTSTTTVSPSRPITMGPLPPLPPLDHAAWFYLSCALNILLFAMILWMVYLKCKKRTLRFFRARQASHGTSAAQDVVSTLTGARARNARNRAGYFSIDSDDSFENDPLVAERASGATDFTSIPLNLPTNETAAFASVPLNIPTSTSAATGGFTSVPLNSVKSYSYSRVPSFLNTPSPTQTTGLHPEFLLMKTFKKRDIETQTSFEETEMGATRV
jgi:hypothetical protein